MFKKLTLFVFIMASAFGAKAQFTIDEDTLYTYGAAGVVSGDFIDIYAHTVIRSKGSMPETIIWQRIANNLPDPAWSSAICDIISCRPPEISFDSFAFANGGDTGVLSFHFYVANKSGNGTMVVRFKRASNPLEYVDVVIMARAWDPTSVNSLNIPATKLYPNPSQNLLTVNNAAISEGTVSVLDANGRKVLEMPFSSVCELNVSGLESGVYSVVISGVNGEILSGTKFVKQ